MSKRLLLFVLLITAAASLLMASNASAQWVNISEPGRNYTDFTISGTTILVGNDGGSGEATLRSPDLGQTWAITRASVAFEARSVQALPDRFIIQHTGNRDFISMDDGLTWTGIDGPGSNVTDTFFDESTGILYVTTQSRNLRRSLDLGDTWEDMGIASSGDELTWVHARGDVIMSGYNNYGGGTWLSTDGGASFAAVAGLGQSSAGFVAENGDLYVLKSDALQSTVSGTLMRSRDNGATWALVATPPNREGVFGGQQTPLRQEALLLEAGGSIMFGHNDRLYVTHDDGATLTEFSEGLIDAGPRASAVKNWDIVGDDLYILLINSNEVGPTDQGFGLYRRPLAEMGFDPTAVAVEHLPGAEKHLLLDIYPNPINGRAMVRTELSSTASVQVSLWDLQGREVARRDYGHLPAGSQTVGLSTLGVPAGMYLLRVETGSTSTTRTVAVVR
ncbi:MAG: T9SS type A sorting domain-containing protein [Rhodothermales bacterium]